MNRKKFHERYKDLFGTNTFSETYKAWKQLSEEERSQLKKQALSKPKQEKTTTFVNSFEEIKTIKKGHFFQFNCSVCGKEYTLVKKCGPSVMEGYKLMMCAECRTDYTFRQRHNGLSRSEWLSQKMKGHTFSEETKKKISEANKKYYQMPGSKEKTSAAIKKAFSENPKSQESIDKQRNSLLKAYQERPEIIEQIRASVSAYNSEHKEELRQKTIQGMAKYFQTEKGKENLENFLSNNFAKHSSTYEDEISSFVAQFVQVKNNVRTILFDHRELDIYVPSKNYAIEYNGNYWHSSANPFNTYDIISHHILKSSECQEKGIRLFHIFEDEYLSFPNEVKDLIKFHLGVDTVQLDFSQLEYKETQLKYAKFFVKSNGLYKGEFQNYKCYYYNNLIQLAILECGEYYRIINRANVNILNIPKLDKNLIWDRRLYFPAQKVIEYTKPHKFYVNGNTRQLEEIPNVPNYEIYDCGDIITEN